MNETAAGNLLEALRTAVSARRLYAADHHLTIEAEAAIAKAAENLVGTSRRALLTAIGDTLYFDGHPLPTMSVKYNGLARTLAEHEVESIAFEAPIAVDDCHELSALLCGQGDGPTSGSIAVNEDPMARQEVSPTSGPRTAYTTSLEALRAVGVSLHKGTGIELTRATSAVRSLLDQLIAQPGAAFLLTTVKSHHEYTFYHSINASILGLALGRLVGLDEEDLVVLGLGALLHDIGKIGVSASILRNPGQLDPSEWVEIKKHPQLGAEAILAAAKPGQEAASVVAFEHHSRFDGKGYPAASRHHHPDGQHEHIDGTPLHFFSRLVAVVDAYDAITTRRSYRRAETPTRALSTLLHGAGTSHDPDFVHAFIRMMGIYPPGTLLQLDGGDIVMITHPSDQPDKASYGVVVADAWGNHLPELEPILVSLDGVVDQLSPLKVGVDPNSLLDRLTERELATAS